MQALLNDLQTWYAAHCDDEWEHAFGIRISTLDNPGWSVQIGLRDTRLENKPFAQIERDETEDSWLVCKVEEKRFVGCGDPSRLEEILGIFLTWAKSEPDWLTPPSEKEMAARRDREFWATLGEEIGPERCAEPGCERKRIQYSVLCRRHHFETIRHRPAPDAD